VPPPPPLRILFAGSGAFGLPTLAAFQSQIVHVISQPDHPAGRGRKLTPTPIAQFAIDHNLPLSRTADINQENLPPADVMIVIAFGQKIAPPQTQHARLGSINLHASLLPKFRGAAPIVRALLAGETITGNSVIRLAPRMDGGAILAQSRIVIGDTETAGELHDRLAQDGVGLIAKALADLAAGAAVETIQDESAATSAAKISRADAIIDWQHSAQSIACQIRALWPWPGCRVRLLDAAGEEISRVTLARARVVEGEGCRWHNGEIETTGHVCAASGQGAVEILELQPQGGRVMPLADFRRGHRWQPGLQLAAE
jgi:methionyl-tRNA formyltransferase